MLLHISKQKKLYKYELVIMYVDILYYYARTNFFLNCDWKEGMVSRVEIKQVSSWGSVKLKNAVYSNNSFYTMSLNAI